MSKISLLALLLVTILATKYTQASVGGYITPADTKKFVGILSKALVKQGDDVLSPYYGAKGLKLLNSPVDAASARDTCAHLQKSLKADSSAETVFNAVNAWSILKCSGQLQNEAILKNIRSILESDKSTSQEIRYAVEVLSVLGQGVPNPSKVSQTLQAKLKEDDSLQSLGHALHAAALLGGNGKFALDRVEEIVVQADEVDGKILQWEGGLTTTSLLITGLLRLPGANPLTQVQADKLANYLLSRRTVQTPKGVLALLEACEALSNSKVSPVSISVIGPSHVTLDKPELKVRVGDLFGRPSKAAVTPVVAQSATRISDDVVVLSKQPLSPGSSSTEFVLPLKLEPGHYRLSITAGSNSLSVETRVLGPIVVQSLEIGLSDSDGSSAPKLTKLQPQAKLSSVLQADSSQHLVVKFSLSRKVHQAFVRLSSGNKEILFVAEQDSSKVYKVEINLGSELSDSGTFDIELIIGDAVVTNPIRWVLGQVKVTLNILPASPKITRGPKPEISHLFRPAEKRPAEFVSLFFTALTLAPILILLGLWLKIGLNFGNFSVVAIPFHVGFGAILALFTLFWLKLNMFVTCAWLIPIGGFTLFSGHKLLSSIARSKKPEKADK